MLKIFAGGAIIQPRPLVAISDVQFDILKLQGSDFFERNLCAKWERSKEATLITKTTARAP